MDEQTLGRIIGTMGAIALICGVFYGVRGLWRLLKAALTKLPDAAQGAGRLTAKAGKLADEFRQGYKNER